MLGLIKQLELVLPQIAGDAGIVPGHGVVSTRADVARGSRGPEGNEGGGRSRTSHGKSLAQLTAERPFRQMAGFGAGWASSDKSLDGWSGYFYRNSHRKPSI
jgi:hypothetical protein